MPNSAEDLTELINAKIETLRPKLLDLSRRNPLISTKLTSRSNSHIRVVDELPDVLFFNLGNGQEMRLVPLPPLEDDPSDEQTERFRQALANARITDPEYLASAEKLDGNSEDYLDLNRKIDRALKDRIRAQLGLAPRPEKHEVNLVQHAKNNGITPSYDLPVSDDTVDDDRFSDLDIQTLQLPKDLERKLSALNSKCNTWIQETGINVLHGAFGFLEWSEPNSTETSFAPLVLTPIKLEKKKTREGLEFWVSGIGEEPEVNAVLSEKLRIDFGIEMPTFEGGSIELFMKEVAGLSPKSVVWRVRRQVVFGVFPSARMAMYHDLNTATARFGENAIIRPIFAGGGAAGATPFADEYQVDEPEIERKVRCLVLDADSSQFSTLVDVADGKNVAVEGPPGTGKSQTIVNAIAAALADGKKVLFVAEKMAALDVVRSRLVAIGLGDFLLPLQAERSTRENVIQSIRERLEMSAARPARDYDDQVEQFRKARDETALYIAAISREFEDTGLTVHDIIGMSIATDQRLAALPKEIQLAEFPLRTGLNVNSIGSLVQKADLLAIASAKAASDHSFWEGVGIVGLNRFDAKKVLRLAETLAGSYETLSDKLEGLGSLGMSDLDMPDALLALGIIFDNAQTLENIEHTELVPILSAGPKLATFEAFLEACEKCQAIERRLRDIFVGDVTAELAEAIAEMESICDAHKIENLDFTQMRESQSVRRHAIGIALKLASQIKPFAELVPGSESWWFTDIQKAQQIVAAAGRDAMICRSQAMGEPAAPSLVRRHNSTGRELISERQSLAEDLSFATSVSTEEIGACLGAFKRAGAFKFLSAEYGRAKRLYLTIARTKFERGQAILVLERLLEWKKRESEFLGNPQVAYIYGLHFRGLDTEFDLFDRLADFYDATRKAFTSAEQRALRYFLQSGDVDLVTDIPTLDRYPEALSLKVVEQSIGRFEAEAEAREKACGRLNSLSAIFRSAGEVAVAELPSLRAAVTEQKAEQARLDGHESVSTILGARFRGWKTEVPEFAQLITTCASIVEFGVAIDRVADVVRSGRSKEAGELVADIDAAFANCNTLAGQLAKESRLDLDAKWAGQDFSGRAVALYIAAADQSGLYAHSEIATARAELPSAMQQLIEGFAVSTGSFDGLGPVIEALAIRDLAKRVYAKHGSVLSKFPGSRLNELRRELARLDRKVIESSREVLKAKVISGARPPSGNGFGKKSTWTDLALIENETSKKQRYIPVRDLTRRAGKALQELKPCWMMSPLAVAQYLPKGLLTFDLCIIDEASQMPPEDSVGALARSRQAMIVGDTNQLPPSSFFRKMVDDEDADEDEAVLDESILEMANATFRPARRLRWHYRSRHSGLIKFSNRLVYNDDLVVFPSATESMVGMGVEFRAVDGLYKAGTNAKEAHEVVEAAIRFMKEDPDRSLGIVTLNQKQRDLIFEEMEYALSQDRIAARYVEDWAERNDGLEQFFIKNLENVQGDERDVIFIGTVYGAETPGARVMQRFGPINGLAGKRRLNVLFSRAKQQIVTFSSMNAGDITAEPDGNEGAYMLKRWLEYSATGLLDAGELTHKEPDSDFEIFVMDQIRAMGCIPVAQVGVKGFSIDIGVKHPQWEHGFILGVECDGAAYHSSKSARDRDRLRQDVLEGLGWRFHRIWSTDWFNDPIKQAGVLRGVITERLAELKAKEAQFSRRPQTAAPAVVTAREPPVRPTQTALDLPTVRPAASGELRLDTSGRVSVGDTVRVRYLTGDKTVVQFTISAESSDPSNGVIHHKKPIAEALLGAEEGDEVEVLVGSYMRQAVLEKIVTRAS